MFERYLFKLNIAVSIGLKSIKELKELAVKFQQYEFTIRISKIEQYLLSVEAELSHCKSPNPTLSRGLTPKGTNFYKEIFTYAIHHHWKNLPKNFIALLKERKTELNEQFEFDEASMYLLT
jgi:hypothetical protein